jgi:hypothetical protein
MISMASALAELNHRRRIQPNMPFQTLGQSEVEER